MKLPLLTELDIGYCTIGNTAFSQLCSISTLKILNIISCENITDVGFHNVWKLTDLQSIDISLCGKITSNGVRGLLDLRQLEMITVSRGSPAAKECLQLFGRSKLTLSAEMRERIVYERYEGADEVDEHKDNFDKRRPYAYH